MQNRKRMAMLGLAIVLAGSTLAWVGGCGESESSSSDPMSQMQDAAQGMAKEAEHMAGDAKDQMASMKQTVCPVSGKDLKSMGDKVVTVDFKGQSVKLCCANCKAKFKANAADYMAKMNAAMK